jgi:hypothetical protein
MSLFNVDEIKKIQETHYNGKRIDEDVEKFCIQAFSEVHRVVRDIDREPDGNSNWYYLLADGKIKFKSEQTSLDCSSSLLSFLCSFSTDYIIVVEGSEYEGLKAYEKAGKHLAYLCEYNQRICEMVFESFFKGKALTKDDIKSMVKSGKFDR